MRGSVQAPQPRCWQLRARSRSQNAPTDDSRGRVTERTRRDRPVASGTTSVQLLERDLLHVGAPMPECFGDKACGSGPEIGLEGDRAFEEAERLGGGTLARSQHRRSDLRHDFDRVEGSRPLDLHKRLQRHRDGGPDRARGEREVGARPRRTFVVRRPGAPRGMPSTTARGTGRSLVAKRRGSRRAGAHGSGHRRCSARRGRHASSRFPGSTCRVRRGCSRRRPRLRRCATRRRSGGRDSRAGHRSRPSVPTRLPRR